MVALKRKAEGDPDEEAENKRKVEQLMRLTREGAGGGGGEGEAGPSTSGASSGSRQMQGQSAESGMHSIDSDEEEEYERTKRVEKMAEDDVEGVLRHQEDRTIDRDGDIQITPFNLKDEEEEGHFDRDGTFMWNKKKGKEDEATDNWLEGVDWGKVRERSQEEVARREAEDEKEDEAEAAYDEVATYRAVLELMKPKESVAKAIQRLGGGKKTTAQKLKEKKRQKEGKETEEEKRNRENMTKLTGMADSILSRSGHMEIYEETYESISYRLKQEEEKAGKKATDIPEGVDDDDALDMFMETAKEEEEEKGEEEEEQKGEAAKPEAISLDDEVKWEFRWEDADDAETHGPHSSEEMLKWQESGFFDKGVFVRKAGSDQEFRDGKRIDFDLYT